MTRPFLLAIAVFALSSAVIVSAQKPAKPKPPSDNYDELVAHYLDTARQQAAAPAADASFWMNNLMGDQRARHVNDLVTVHVRETMSATGTADASLTKKSTAGAGVSSLGGAEKKLPSLVTPESLVGAQTKTDFTGAGNTTRTGDLSAIITARVAEVLPNGDLVLEGVRELEINGDRQVVVLTGVARVADVGPGNVVPSAALGQLRIRYFGKGLMKDNLSPGFLVKLVNKIF